MIKALEEGWSYLHLNPARILDFFQFCI